MEQKTRRQNYCSFDTQNFTEMYQRLQCEFEKTQAEQNNWKVNEGNKILMPTQVAVLAEKRRSQAARHIIRDLGLGWERELFLLVLSFLKDKDHIFLSPPFCFIICKTFPRFFSAFHTMPEIV